MFLRLIDLRLLALLITLTLSERFADHGEHNFIELSNQWEYLTKFAFAKNGNIELLLKFKRPDSESKVVRVAFYQMAIESWDSTVRSTKSCKDRLELAQGTLELVVEEDKETEKERECFHYYGDTVCKITRNVDGSTLPWVFVAVLYCDNDITGLELEWQMHATNGKSFLVREAPVNDMGLYQAYLAFTIISALLIVFWVLYYKDIKLNMRVAIPYKIALFISFVGFALVTGFYGRLLSTGYRNDSLFNSGFVFSMIGYTLVVQSSLAAVWSGSIITVHLPRWKTVLTFVVPIVFVIAMLAVYTVQYFDVAQRDVYPFEQRSDRYLVWVVLGFSLVIWLLYTVPIIATISSKDVKIMYLRILYLILSIYMLAVGGTPLIANFNMRIEKRKLFVLACFGTAHLLNFLFLFLCIKDNHTLKSLRHFWWVILHDYICCKFKLCPCLNCGNKGKQTGNGDKSSQHDMYGGKRGRGGKDRRGGCVGCCLSMCPCLTCCPGCKGDDQEGKYASETDLKKILVQNKNVEDFDLKIVDMGEDQSTKRKITPDSIIESEPIVINSTPAKQPKIDVIDGFSDDEAGHQTKRKANGKVLPWLYQDKPTKDLSPGRRFSNAVIERFMNVKEHGYKGGDPNHWKKGNHKAFATAENKPIVLYKRPDSDNLFSASQASFNSGKPVHFVPVEGQINVPAGHSNQIIPVVARSFSSQANVSPRLFGTGSSLRKSTESPDLDDGEADTFNIAEYNSSKLRETKVKTNTMMYRRETLKQNLSNVPTPLLLQRVPDGTIKNESGWDQVISKTKIVKKTMKPKVEAKSVKSQADLWKSLAKKYSGKPLEESGSDVGTSRSVQSRIKTPRINGTGTGTPNTMSSTVSNKKSPRTFNTAGTRGSGK